jgi:trimeric autotransporter adhesin
MKTQSLRTPRLVALFAFSCFALSELAQAVSPPPDGGYSGFNTAEGQNALFNLSTGVGNAAVGWFSLWSNTDGSYNTAVGAGTLLFNMGDQSTGEGTRNTAMGTVALFSNTTGLSNTATGVLALFSNTEGNFNTANGGQTLFSNTTGSQNTATGIQALFNNTSGTQNTATGASTLVSNTTGSSNTANGGFALFNNTEGGNNTATGFSALTSNVTGGSNTANGAYALSSNTGGVFNTAIGNFALPNSNADSNTAVGSGALFNSTTGAGNIAFGVNAGSGVTDAHDVIAIGADAENVNNSCFIGQIYSNIQPQVGTDPDLVTINSSGRLGRANVSSRRYKHDIQPMHKASEAIYALKPVSFRYHRHYDATQTLAFGLIAEEVAEVVPDLVGRNERGEPESVRYEQINAMLLNEFLKEHRKVQKLETALEVMSERLKEQDAKIQRVSAQLQMSGPESQALVAENQ